MRNLYEIYILTALAAGDSHGYGVIRQLAEDGVAELAGADRQVYRMLKRLAEDRLVSARGLDRQVVYRLTPLGRRRLKGVSVRLFDAAQQMRERL